MTTVVIFRYFPISPTCWVVKNDGNPHILASYEGPDARDHARKMAHALATMEAFIFPNRRPRVEGHTPQSGHAA